MAPSSPSWVKQRQTRLEGFDEKVLALYGRGMSTRDMRELYGTDVSHELISKATKGVLELFREWQTRPLDAHLFHRLSRDVLRGLPVPAIFRMLPAMAAEGTERREIGAPATR